MFAQGRLFRMAILDPDALNIVLRYVYRDCKVELDQRQQDGTIFYVVWIHHAGGCAIADYRAPSRTVAVKRAKHWINQHQSHR